MTGDPWNFENASRQFKNYDFSDFFPTIKTTDDYQWKEDENKFYIALKLPGVPKENISVILENGLLKVEGKSKTWYSDYEYKKEFKLNDEFDEDKVSAKLENGFLEIVLNKSKKLKKTIIKLE